MMTDNSNAKRSGGGPAPTDPALSSTMRLPLEELVDPDAEMYLDVRHADNSQPRRIRIEKQTYEIGRHPDAGVPLMQASVSRQHALLFNLHSEEIIEDLHSTNGTYVNGVRIARCVLQHNDVIRIGDATLLFTRTPRGAK